MNNFNYLNPTQIIFGKDEEKNIAKHVKKYGKKVLLHYGGGSIKQNGIYDTVVSALKEHNIEFIELAGVQPNPRLALVEEGIALCKKQQIDFILAVGGGSVIDSAKAIAIGALSDTPIWDYFIKEDNSIDQALPIGVILTIPAAGSESSTGTVITNQDSGLKRSTGSPLLSPKFAILNPELTYTMPKYQIACGAADILAHLLERYFTQVQHVDLTDRLLEAAIRTVLINAPIAMKKPTDYNVRAEMMLVGNIAHNSSLSIGRIGDWASHDIEHELSGMYDIAHGAGLAIIFPAWMKYVYNDNIDKFIQFAVRVFDVDLAYTNKDAIVLEMIARLETWFQSLDLPVRLSDANINEDKLQEMAEKALLHRSHLGNFKKLNSKDVLEIYKLAK